MHICAVFGVCFRVQNYYMMFWYFKYSNICAVFGVFGVVCPGLSGTKLSCCDIVSVTASSDSLDEHSQ